MSGVALLAVHAANLLVCTKLGQSSEQTMFSSESIFTLLYALKSNDKERRSYSPKIMSNNCVHVTYE